MQARNFITNVPKILDLKSSCEQIFSENGRWVPLPSLVCEVVLEIFFCLRKDTPGYSLRYLLDAR